jgi:hypothetical protein
MKPMPMNVVTERAAELGGCMNEVVDGMRAKVETAQQDVTRTFRRAKVKAEDMLEEGRHEIKESPLAALAGFMALGLALGFAVGVFTGARKFRQ